ncbi:SAB, partial [Trifolium medium]|nr:SAB [Trifolium medium]
MQKGASFHLGPAGMTCWFLGLGLGYPTIYEQLNKTKGLRVVEIYPLKIHLQESMYRMMWVYFFPEEEKDSQRRQEVWKVSTTAGARRVKKGPPANEAASSSNQSGISALLFPATNQPSVQAGSAQ